MSEKRCVGRPRRAAEDRRTEGVHVLLRPREKEAVCLAAKNSGMSIVAYVRVRLGLTAI